MSPKSIDSKGLRESHTETRQHLYQKVEIGWVFFTGLLTSDNINLNGDNKQEEDCTV